MRLARLIAHAAALSALSWSASSWAQPIDAERGLALATQLCSACHVVADDQATTDQTGAPAFAALAGTQAATPDGLLVAVRRPHPRMPKIDLARRDAADLSAYIATLGAD